jgi:hypothetical protein
MMSTIPLIKRGLRNPTRVPAYLLRRVKRPPLIGINPCINCIC